MSTDDGHKCPFCGRYELVFHETHWAEIGLCRACGYEDEWPYDRWIEEVLEYRLQEPEPDDTMGFPALGSIAHALAMYGWCDKLMQHLLDWPADLARRAGDTGWTLLHAAAAGNQVGIVHHLLLRGMNPDTADLAGDTALHIAARWDCRDVTAELLAAGAAADLRNSAGQTAEEVAVARRHHQAVQLLRGSSVRSAHVDSSAADSTCQRAPALRRDPR